jgi:uncharacterized protein
MKINKKIKINKRIIANSYNSMKNIWQKAKGLMFCTKVKEPLIFPFEYEQKISLHMWFVFMPIDVLYLNKNKEIIEIKENFKPFTYFIPKKLAKYIVELEKNTIRKNKIKLGQKVDF